PPVSAAPPSEDSVIADPTAAPTEVQTEVQAETPTEPAPVTAETDSGTNFVRPTQPEGTPSAGGQAIEFSAGDTAETKEPLLDITTLIPVGQPKPQPFSPSTTEPRETAPTTEAATPEAATPEAATPEAATSEAATVAALSPKQFRVLVTPRPGETLSQLQRVVPQASAAERNGQQLFVVGVYDSRTDTQAVLDRLTEEGYIATAEVVGADAS
ncbi:MAG: hypothetical protein AAFY15_08475, partial [Cyanobacteria bacterium J06648_11]